MTSRVSDFLVYLQYRLGAESAPGGLIVPDTSWSARLQGSETLWMVLEGTHVLTIMLFAGTILFVDLRLLGLVLRETPVSSVSKAVLPYTVAGFAVMVLTGGALFFANPLEYYHSFIFRLKAVFLLLAALNIFYFHWRASAGQNDWDTSSLPPLRVRASAAASVGLWLLVIATGRYAAYDWFSCDVATGLIAEVSQCDQYHSAMLDAEQGFSL